MLMLKSQRALLHDLGFSGSDAQRVATDEFYSYDVAVLISDETM